MTHRNPTTQQLILTPQDDDFQVLSSRGLLAGKTRLLVTHGLLYAKEAEPVLVMDREFASFLVRSLMKR